jgi:hypothetical protein
MSLGILILYRFLTGAVMTFLTTSLLDILVPPRNPWLSQFVPGKTELPRGIRVIRHAGVDEDRFDRNERLHTARRKLHDWRVES